MYEVNGEHYIFILIVRYNSILTISVKIHFREASFLCKFMAKYTIKSPAT